MYKENGIFEYYYINSHIHKLNPMYKILSLIIFFMCSVFANGVIDMVIINIYLLMMMLWSNVKLRAYFNNLSIIKIMILFIFLLVSLLTLNIWYGLLWSIKIIDIILYISILTMTTTLNEIVYGVESIICIFDRVFDVSYVSLKIGMILKFVSMLHSERSRINISKRLRGVRVRDMTLMDKVRTYCSESVLIYRLTSEDMDKLRDVMYIRNYGVSISRNNYRLNKWGKTDTILLVINVLVVFITMIY